MSACRSCGKIIRWAHTENDRPIPLDVEPVLGGNIVLIHGQRGPMAVVSGGKPDVEGFVSHFTTCPNAAAHRKARERVKQPPEAGVNGLEKPSEGPK